MHTARATVIEPLENHRESPLNKKRNEQFQWDFPSGFENFQKTIVGNTKMTPSAYVFLALSQNLSAENALSVQQSWTEVRKLGQADDWISKGCEQNQWQSGRFWMLDLVFFNWFDCVF